MARMPVVMSASCISLEHPAIPVFIVRKIHFEFMLTDLMMQFGRATRVAKILYLSVIFSSLW